MRLKVDRDAFRRALQSIRPWVARRTPLDALKYAHLAKCGDAEIQISASNAEGSAFVRLGAEFTDDDAAPYLIPVDIFDEALGKGRGIQQVSLQTASVPISDPSWKCPKIEVKDEKTGALKKIDDPDAHAPIIDSPFGICLVMGVNRFRWPTPNPAEHPAADGNAVDLIAGERWVAATASDFLRGMRAALAAVDPKAKGHYALAGVFAQRRKDDRLILVGSDGRMVSEQALYAVWGNGLSALPDPTVLDSDGLVNLCEALAESSKQAADAEIQLHFPESRRGFVVAKVGALYATVRLLEGRYPNHRIPFNDLGDPIVTIPLESRSDFLAVVRQAAVMCDGKKDGVDIEFPGDGTMLAWAEIPEYGCAEVRAPCPYGPGADETPLEPFLTAVRPQYLLDAIEGAPTGPPFPTLKFYGMSQPIHVQGDGHEFLIMSCVTDRTPKTPALRDAYQPVEGFEASQEGKKAAKRKPKSKKTPAEGTTP